MRTKDFEKAIENLGKHIVIDEMVLRNNNVKTVYGHGYCTFFKWDAEGNAYAAYSDEELPQTVIDTKKKVDDCDWKRNFPNDLNFN